MKKFKFLFFGFFALALFACTNQYNDLNRDSDVLSGNENIGGFLEVAKTSIAYVVGNGNTFVYGTNLSAFQSTEKVAKVEIFNQFTTVAGVKSNKVLLKTYNFPNTAQLENYINNFTYDDLRAGITVSGTLMSPLDTTLSIGDYWTLTYVTTTVSGKVRTVADTTKVSVATRLAGNYRCISGTYYRIGILTYVTTDWPAETTIESVNTTTYRVKKYFGPFNNSSVPTGGDFYFTVNNSGQISYPANTPTGVPQSGNGQPFISCASHPADMTLSQCGASNFVTLDFVNGKDKLTMSFGYLNSPGASRQFYQVLEKI